MCSGMSSVGPEAGTPLHSQQLYERARRCEPGGASASARMNQALGLPLYVARGDGARIYDVDGNEYIDFCISHGASILGHNHPAIKEAVQRALEMGILCSYETEYHVALAEKIVKMVPGAEMVRFSGSGTETIMHTLRLAREFTGKDKIIKFEGHFHGYDDYIYWSTRPPLDEVGPPEAPLAYPQSGGIPEGLRDYIIVIPFNDPAVLERTITNHKDDVAALIMEPINYDAGCITPQPGFMEQIGELTAQNNILLIFDEVLTAFRMAPGGAQEYLGVVPDLAVLGKATGGGMPLSAITGKREVMTHVRPLGNAEHSGTYMGHLIPVMGSLACLNELSRPGVYEHLHALGEHFYADLWEIIRHTGVRARLQYIGPRFFIYFGLDPDEEVINYRMAARHDPAMALQFTREVMKRSVYFHDYGGKVAHHGFSVAHTLDDMDQALDAIQSAFKALARGPRARTKASHT